MPIDAYKDAGLDRCHLTGPHDDLARYVIESRPTSHVSSSMRFVELEWGATSIRQRHLGSTGPKMWSRAWLNSSG